MELDSNFATAYRAMASAYGGLGEVGRSQENARKAYELRQNVSERERFLIEGTYYAVATGELEKAIQVFELWKQTYPRDAYAYLAAGDVYRILGNLEQTVEEHRKAMPLELKNRSVYVNLGFDYVALNRLDEAEAMYEQAEEEFLLQYRYPLAFLKGESAQMARVLSAAMGKPEEDMLLAMQADTEGWYGKLNAAHELTRQAMDSAEHKDAKQTAATYPASAGLREVEAGNREQARAEAHAALKLAPNRDVRALAALALARAGDTAAAEKVAAELDKQFPAGRVKSSLCLQSRKPLRSPYSKAYPYSPACRSRNSHSSPLTFCSASIPLVNLSLMKAMCASAYMSFSRGMSASSRVRQGDESRCFQLTGRAAQSPNCLSSTAELILLLPGPSATARFSSSAARISRLSACSIPRLRSKF